MKKINVKVSLVASQKSVRGQFDKKLRRLRNQYARVKRRYDPFTMDDDSSWNFSVPLSFSLSCHSKMGSPFYQFDDKNEYSFGRDIGMTFSSFPVEFSALFMANYEYDAQKKIISIR